MVEERDKLINELERTNDELQKILNKSRPSTGQSNGYHNKDGYGRVRNYLGEIHSKDSYEVAHCTSNSRVPVDYVSNAHVFLHLFIA